MEQTLRRIGAKTRPLILKLKDFKGRRFIDLRYHYVKDDDILPTKRGVMLSKEALIAVLSAIDEESEVISEYFDLKNQEVVDLEVKRDVVTGRSFEVNQYNGKVLIKMDEERYMGIDDKMLHIIASVLRVVTESLNAEFENEIYADSILSEIDYAIKKIL